MVITLGFILALTKSVVIVKRTVRHISISFFTLL